MLKKILKTLGISIVLVVLFRGPIYRWTIHYHEVGSRASIKLTDKKLMELIDQKSADHNLKLDDIVDIALEITSNQVQFSSQNTSQDPNTLQKLKKANCIGYSALFNSIVLYLVSKNNLTEQIQAKHMIGEMHFLGFNIHQFFESSFFKDHDFNMLSNNLTGDSVFVDPSLYDYLRIKKVSAGKSY